MKVKQNISSRCSIKELGTPLQEKKPKGNALVGTPSPTPRRFSSMYVSPLGNVAGPKTGKKNKSASKQKEEDTPLVECLSESGSRNSRKTRRKKMKTVQKILGELLDVPPAMEVIVIPDTPTDNPSVKRSEGLEDFAETPSKRMKQKNNKKKKSRSRDRSVILADEPTPCNGSGPWAVESSCSERDDGGEKTEKREECPSEIEEIPVAVTSKRKKSECDVAKISPPRKKRKVTLGVEGSSLAVTLANVTIDLEAEGDPPTVTVSDEEDEAADDIIVLGSPAVPSVRSYKAVGRSVGRGPRHPMSGIIARALATMEGPPVPTPAPVPVPVPASPANVYGGNIYNPGATVQKTGLRPIIIDASNVAMGHGNGKVFSCRGIEICVNYFLKRKHKVFAFLPKFRRHNTFTKDAYLLDKLQANNHLIFTPSRYVDGQSDVPYDDRYIVQTAAELGGVIVSTDNYRDLLQENPHWHDTIKNRLLMFTWVEDLLIFPQDPLGRRGCRLEEFLRF